MDIIVIDFQQILLNDCLHYFKSLNSRLDELKVKLKE